MKRRYAKHPTQIKLPPRQLNPQWNFLGLDLTPMELFDGVLTARKAGQTDVHLT